MNCSQPLLSLSWPVPSLDELQQEVDFGQDLWSVAFCAITGHQFPFLEKNWGSDLSQGNTVGKISKNKKATSKIWYQKD